MGFFQLQVSLCKAKLPGAKEVPLVPEEAATLTKMFNISTCSNLDFSLVPDNQAVGLQFLSVREERDAHQREELRVWCIPILYLLRRLQTQSSSGKPALLQRKLAQPTRARQHERAEVASLIPRNLWAQPLPMEKLAPKHREKVISLAFGLAAGCSSPDKISHLGLAVP